MFQHYVLLTPVGRDAALGAKPAAPGAGAVLSSLPRAWVYPMFALDCVT